ncbi:hypothetical protein DdX_05200 [Ditylenchus destructor]|uniref:Uncharacterized protein n=1 Tax=Ditylenchus destructor TaxID=166010 RepID=A0AAD4NDX5_9BILA|nr:hypothetical protein DdX_05200 [Ditylenchus destructor]
MNTAAPANAIVQKCVRICTAQPPEETPTWIVILILTVTFGPILCIAVCFAVAFCRKSKKDKRNLVGDREKCHTWCTPSLCQNPIHKKSNVYETC